MWYDTKNAKLFLLQRRAGAEKTYKLCLIRHIAEQNGLLWQLTPVNGVATSLYQA